jgi:hypothetical protein
MALHNIVILPPAPRGSKKGWKLISAKVPPDTKTALLELVQKRVKREGDLIQEAVEDLLRREGILAA